MMKYHDLYFASRYNFFTDCVEWYILSKNEIKVFLKKNGYTSFWLVTIDIRVVLGHLMGDLLKYASMKITFCVWAANILTFTPN